jgi:hypothetical protein
MIETERAFKAKRQPVIRRDLVRKRIWRSMDF